MQAYYGIVAVPRLIQLQVLIVLYLYEISKKLVLIFLFISSGGVIVENYSDRLLFEVAILCSVTA